jgi:hypothetical protein
MGQVRAWIHRRVPSTASSGRRIRPVNRARKKIDTTLEQSVVQALVAIWGMQLAPEAGVPKEHMECRTLRRRNDNRQEVVNMASQAIGEGDRSGIDLEASDESLKLR